MYFSTVVDIFPHVETHFLERVREKFVLDARGYRFLLNDRYPTSKCVH